MLSKKYFFGVVQRFTSAESVQQLSWKHGLALGIMNASERTVKYIGRVTSPCQWTGIIKANRILVSGWFQAQSHPSRSCPASGATSEQPDAEYWF